MYKSVSLSVFFHLGFVLLTALTLPFIKKEPITAQQLIAIDIIQISEKTQIPFAPKAREIIEKIKKEKKKERVVTKQAPPKITPKEKPKVYNPRGGGGQVLRGLTARGLLCTSESLRMKKRWWNFIRRCIVKK